MTTTRHRILALDGGGIRGMISVEVLDRIERLLRERTGDPDLRLCDWFDLIAGTSTGAITAAVLATGHTADDVRRFYEEEADALFQTAGLRDRAYYRYEAEHLASRLQEVLGAGITLGSDRIRTLLLLVLLNATTDSPWFLTSNPNARFNDRRLPGCNMDLPLWQLVRAITPLDRSGNRAEFREVGAALAEARVRSEHFNRFVPVRRRVMRVTAPARRQTLTIDAPGGE